MEMMRLFHSVALDWLLLYILCLCSLGNPLIFWLPTHTSISGFLDLSSTARLESTHQWLFFLSCLKSPSVLDLLWSLVTMSLWITSHVDVAQPCILRAKCSIEIMWYDEVFKIRWGLIIQDFVCDDFKNQLAFSPWPFEATEGFSRSI